SVSLLLRRISALVGLRPLLHLLRRRRLRRICGRHRGRLDLGLDHGLLDSFGRRRVVVRPRLLDVLVPVAWARAAARRALATATAAAGRTPAAPLAPAAGRTGALPRPAPRALAGTPAAGPAACTAGTAATGAATPLAHRAQALAVLATAAAAL